MYEIGQRVELVIDHPDNNYSLVRGDTGTVVKVYGDGATQSIGVQWDKYVNGHDWASDTCLEGHGWWVFCTDIVPSPSFSQETVNFVSEETLTLYDKESPSFRLTHNF